ncbi:hypothetical protein [Ruegeria sp. MALMAid1280]|uniref:hypothetical protein n=1 Tax=Ruegeria sp. MALMAid1280 TaxID=3411634 RepID=UPI003B9EDD3E
MSFSDQPILNSSYSYPNKHWKLDDDVHPTDRENLTRIKFTLWTALPGALWATKGFRGHDAMLKTKATCNKWIPAENRPEHFGCRGFVEMRSICDFNENLDNAIASPFSNRRSLHD